MNEEPAAYEFGPFRLEIAAHRIYKHGALVELAGLRWDLLVYLVQKHGCNVPEEDVYKLLWPDSPAGDLQSRLKDVRKKLRDQLEGEDVAAKDSVIKWTKKHLSISIEVRPIYSERGPLPLDRLSGLAAPQNDPPLGPPLALRLSQRSLETFSGLPKRAWIEVVEYFGLLVGLLLRPKRTLTTSLGAEPPDLRRALKFVMYSGILSVALFPLIKGSRNGSDTLRDYVAGVLFLAGITLCFYCAWLIAWTHTPRLRVLTGTCYVAAVFVLLSCATTIVADLTLHIMEPDCLSFATPGCSTGDVFWDLLHSDDHVVTRVGLEGIPRARPLDGPGRIPFVVVYSICATGMVLWLLITWWFLRKLFSTGAVRAFISLLLAWMSASLLTSAVTLYPEWLPGHNTECGLDYPDVPTLNVWPVAYDGAPCHDYPLIDIAIRNSKDKRNGRFALSQAEHDAGITASVGDRLTAEVFFHNGAGCSPDVDTTAKHVMVKFSLKQVSSTSYTVAADLSAQNARKVSSGDIGKGGDVPVALVRPATLHFVPGTAHLCVRPEHAQLLGADPSQKCCPTCLGVLANIRVPVPDSIFLDGLDIGSLPGCCKYEGFARVEIDVRASVH
jgi:hypothetical protein